MRAIISKISKNNQLLKGTIETPHDGDWGWDFEMDGIYEHDVLMTRACGPGL